MLTHDIWPNYIYLQFLNFIRDIGINGMSTSKNVEIHEIIVPGSHFPILILILDG